MEFVEGDYIFIYYNEEYEEEGIEPYCVELRNEFTENRDKVFGFYPTHKEALDFANGKGIDVDDNVF